jgi:signal transduction histidine kinase
MTLYTVAVRERFALSLAVALTTIAAIGVVLLTGPIEPSTGDWIANALVLTLGWSFGRSVQSRRTRIASLDARDEAVAAAESAHRHWVELQRRAELAQELQDLVAHNLTQITVQMAGARRMVDHDPALAKSTLGQAEEAGRAAMHEMRRLFDVLKASDTSAQLTPAPGLGDLQRLASSKREAGVDVVVTTEGTLDHVPGSVGLTVYRVVEEALTNAQRHASARAVHVDLSCSSELLRLKVVNPGDHATPQWMHDPAPADGDDRVGAGGLRRLQSRLALFGGHMTWDRRRDGGFVVEVEVPITPMEGTP